MSYSNYYHLAVRFKNLLFVCILLMIVDSVFVLLNVASVAPLMDLLLKREETQWLTITHHMKEFIENMGFDFSLSSAALILWITLTGMAIVTILIRIGTLKIRAEVIRVLTLESMDKLLNSSWDYFTKINRGKLINTFTNEINKSGSALTIIAQSVALVFRAVAFVILPIIIAPKLSLICMFVAIIGIIPFILLGKFSFSIGGAEVTNANKFITLLKESLDGAREIMGFGMRSSTIRHIGNAYNNFANKKIKGQVINFSSSQIYEPLGSLAILAMIIIADTSQLPLSQLGIVAWGFMRVISPLRQLISNKHQLNNFMPSLDQVLTQQKEAIRFTKQSGNIVFNKLSDGISVKDVSYKYSKNQDENTIENIDFDLPKGSIVALVGESGSGKSTLADIIVGLLSPDKGNVQLDGVNLMEYDIQSWREKIALVSQQPILFDLSIRKNISWANENATEKDIWHACKIAGAKNFINALPEKLETEIGDLGVRLSGGQIQRIALARALVRKPLFLLLDEATSALDSENESSIFNDIYSYKDQMTVLVIAHRLSTVVKADVIYVMKKGKILEKGDYNSLIKNSNYFNNLINLQKL